jgi:hypothetical protein
MRMFTCECGCEGGKDLGCTTERWLLCCAGLVYGWGAEECGVVWWMGNWNGMDWDWIGLCTNERLMCTCIRCEV